MPEQWMSSSSATPQASGLDVVQAGFLRRWAALFLDQLILTMVFYALMFGVILLAGLFGEFSSLESQNPDEMSPAMMAVVLGLTAFYYVAAGAYYALMESSRHQATVGKMVLGIKVVDAQGARLNFGHALGRWFAAALSYLTLYIGFLMAAFTHDKRALHDMLANTFVVDQWAYTEHPERQSRKPGGCVIALMVATALMILLSVVAIVAAIALPAYQDYRGRAQTMAMWQPVGVLRDKVVAHQQDKGQCPENDSEGFGSPESYSMEGVNRIVIGEFETGFCGISVWMPPTRGNVERQFLLEFDTNEHIWYCTNKADIKKLPSWCN